MADYDIIELRKKDSGDVFYPLTHVDAVIGLTDQSFFMKDASGNVTLKPQYQNLWVPGWLAAGGVGTGGGGGGGGLISTVYGVSSLGTKYSGVEDYSATFSAKAIDTIYHGLQNTYTKTQVDNLIGSISSFAYEIYPATSSVTNPSPNILYLIGPTGTGADKYEEYVYANSAWTKIGDTSVDLASCGASLSVTNTTSNLQDSQGQYLVDSNGNYLVTSDLVSHINLLNSGGTVLSSVTLPTTVISGVSVTIGSTTIPLGGSATLSQIGVPLWAQAQSLEFSALPTLYVGKTRVKDTNTSNDTLVGINGFTTAASPNASGDASYVVWEPNAGGTGIGAWHFKGNIYTDGWIAAGGVGTGGGGGGGASWMSDLQDVSASNPSTGNILIYDSTQPKPWVSKNLTTSPSGSGNAVTSISYAGGVITYTKGSTFLTSETDPVFSASAAAGITSTNITNWTSAYNTVSGSKTKNYVFAAPSNANGSPSFRALVAADIPSLTISKISDAETWIAGKNYITGNQTITLSGDVSGSGTTSITVSIGTGKVTNAMLAGNIENSKLNTIGVAKGGTGLTSITKGAILYASAANTIAALSANGTSTKKFLTQTNDGAPAWGVIAETDMPDSYLKRSGGTMTGPIERQYASASNSPMLKIGSNNQDIQIFKVYSSDGTYSETGSIYGYALKYIGTGEGVTNYLRLVADNCTGPQVTAIGVNQSGQVGILMDANTNYSLSVSGNSYFNGSVKIGANAYLVYDSDAKALRVYGTDGGSNIGFYCDGWVAAGGVGSGGGSGTGSLEGCVDVEISSPHTSGDLLRYNGTKWVNVPQTEIVPTITATPSGTGNAVTALSYSNGVITYTKGSTFLTSSDLDGYVNAISTSSGNYITGVSKSGKTLTFTYGTLPTTIALSNVTGADDLKAIETLTGGGLLKRDGTNNTWSLDSTAYTTNTGTVTSITLTAGPGISVSNSGTAITTYGTRTIALASGVCTVGTYRSVSVDTYGRVTSGTNPTTLSGYGITDAGASLSVTNTTSNLQASNGSYLVDSNGRYLVTSDLVSHINLLNGSGTVLSSVTLPTTVISSLSVTVGSATIAIGGSATLSQIGVPLWAQSPSLSFDAIPPLYVGKTAVKNTNTSNDTLVGIDGFTTAASPGASNDASLVKWENGAWHFYGNIYADGWVSAGGVGTSSGNVVSLDDLSDVTLSTRHTGDLLYYDGSKWINKPQSEIVPTITVSPSGTGNGVTGLSYSNGVITYTKGTFLTASDLTTNNSVYGISDATTWNNNRAGVQVLNAISSAVTGAPRQYETALSVWGYYGFQLSTHSNSNKLSFRSSSSNAGSWSDWVEIYHTGNISSWAGSSAITTVGTLTSGSVPLSLVTGADELKLIEALTGGGLLKRDGTANTWSLDSTAYTTNTGTVTSVTIKGGAGISVSSSSAITTTGTRTISIASDYQTDILHGANAYTTLTTVRSANTVFAGPSSGSSAAPTFRALVAADIPSLSVSKLSDLSSWTGSSSITTVGTLSSGSVPLSLVTGADDIKAIEAITGTSGLLKKTAANTWSLDTTSYLSSHQTVTLATGTNSGTLKLTTAAGTTDNVAVKNCVTTDQTQTISGAKTFSATISGVDISLTGSLSMASTSHIDIGPVRIEYNASSKAIHITKVSSSDTNDYGIFADGFVAAGGTQS